MQGHNHTGPIIFSDKTARSQLVEEGSVVTFRTTERTTGDTWWRKSRTGPKEGDCTVTHIGAIDPTNPDELAPYQDESGFQSVEAWREAIKELNGGLSCGHLYRAQLTD
jgi:hypothetical protein